MLALCCGVLRTECQSVNGGYAASGCAAWDGIKQRHKREAARWCIHQACTRAQQLRRGIAFTGGVAIEAPPAAGTSSGCAARRVQPRERAKRRT
jgi:hypothetical protein